MRKLLTYLSFIVATAFVVYIFLTAKSYVQLAAASILYIPLAFFAYNLFQRGAGTSGIALGIPMPLHPIPVRQTHKTHTPPEKSDKVDVVDIDKRTFLKLIGAIGLTFFVTSLFGRRAENILFQGASAPGRTSGTTPERLPADGYQISEIDESENAYYGFINKNGQWFIMKEDAETGSFRYTKGNSDFPGNWANRDGLYYDYYHNLF